MLPGLSVKYQLIGRMLDSQKLAYTEDMSNSKFELIRAKNAPVTDEELINDLKRVSEIAGTGKVTQKVYGEYGKYDVSNLGRRFGTWNKALQSAGLSISNEINISDERLFENILVLWQHYGRQPVRAELAMPPSLISQGAYRRRFSSWLHALECFVEYANASDSVAPNRVEPFLASRLTTRDPSLRLRFKVMLRDNFTCRHCGASSAKQPGVELHIDHVIPWSKEGETTLNNLQTLCSRCNLGKSNLSEVMS
jgi:hypothetical protein